MANNHGYVSTARTMSEDVGTLNRVGIKDDANIDNGVLVTITEMIQDSSSHKATDFAYKVGYASTGGSVADDALYIVATPPVGSDVEMQEYSDPRHFYNAQGRPMAIKKLMKGIDEIEVTKECFTDSALPTNTNKHIIIGDNGKMTAGSATANAYFDLVALHSMDIGMEKVPTAILRYTGKQS